MKRQSVFTNRSMTVCFALIAVFGMLFLAGCGGGSCAGKADSSKADIGKEVMVGNWTITLTGAVHSLKNLAKSRIV